MTPTPTTSPVELLPPLRDLRAEVAAGLLFAHSRLNATTSKTLETAAFVFALIELMTERGLISEAELDQRKRAAGLRLASQIGERGLGVLLQDPEYDKYTFESEVTIDCPSRIPLCHAACCRLPFALSKQDVREGVIRWDLGQPYVIAQDEDGYCSHFDRGCSRCTVHQQRPVPCRAYDCRQDKRIWLDFEAGIVNPRIHRPDWPQCEVPEAGPARSAAGQEPSAGSGA